MKMYLHKVSRLFYALSFVFAVLTGCSAGADVPVNPSETVTPEIQDKEISILAVGNSFSTDALEYLYGILEDVGYEKIVLGNLYIGGCSLSTHHTNFSGDLSKYTYYKNTDGAWSKTSDFSPLTALKDEDWDYISMQQVSGSSGLPSTYEPYLSGLINIVREHCKDSRLIWHMTWAYQANSTHKDFPKYGSDQMTMYNSIVNAVQTTILPMGKFEKVIPSGTAVQNMRTSFVGDNLTRDGYHLSLDKGRYLAAMTFAKALTGCDLSDVTYAPAEYMYSETLIAAMKDAADKACAEPYKVTESAYPPDKNFDLATADLEDIVKNAGFDPEGYQALDLGYVNYAYYNSSNSTMKSTMYTADNKDIHKQTNYTQFVATRIFAKSEIPNGSIIVMRSGYQYRPEGWTEKDTYNSSGRPGNVTDNVVQVTDTWWGKWNYRAFNLSISGRPALTDETARKVQESFGIFIPRQ